MSARKQDAKTKRTFARMDAVKADAERAVAAFMSAWDRIDGKGWPYVPPTEVEGYVLLALCEALCKRIDGFQSRPPDALLKLSNALADYRDSRWEDRGGPLTEGDVQGLGRARRAKGFDDV